jgi:hypothetical protein
MVLIHYPDFYNTYEIQNRQLLLNDVKSFHNAYVVA